MDYSNGFSWDKYSKAPIVGIIRGMPNEQIFWIAEVYAESGLNNLEITMNTKGAAQLISDLRIKFPSLNIGAGTVCSIADYEAAIGAGAQYIVAPIVEETVISKAVKDQIPIFPGAYSPTEIYKAWSLGASAVKVFPAAQLGPKYIKDVLGPLDQIKLLPTGGVTLENIGDFFAAGAFGVGMGSALFDKEMIKQKDVKKLNKHFMKLRKAAING